MALSTTFACRRGCQRHRLGSAMANASLNRAAFSACCRYRCARMRKFGKIARSNASSSLWVPSPRGRTSAPHILGTGLIEGSARTTVVTAQNLVGHVRERSCGSRSERHSAIWPQPATDQVSAQSRGDSEKSEPGHVRLPRCDRPIASIERHTDRPSVIGVWFRSTSSTSRNSGGRGATGPHWAIPVARSDRCLAVVKHLQRRCCGPENTTGTSLALGAGDRQVPEPNTGAPPAV